MPRDERGGPFSRLETAEQRLADLEKAGTTGALLRDAEIVLKRTQAAVARAEVQLAGGPGMEQRFETFLRSTRFTGGGGVMPLVGRTADVLGIEGPLLSKLTIAGAVVSTFTSIVKTAAEHVGDLGTAARLSGGSPGDVGFLAGFGQRGEAAAGRAAAFHALISTPGFAMATAARIPGMTPGMMIPRPFGDTNEARPLKLAVQYLESLGPTAERLREARILDLEWTLRFLDTSKETRRQLDEIIKAEEKLADPKHAQAALDLSQKVEMVTQKWEQLTAKLGTPALTTASGILDSFLDPVKSAKEDLEHMNPFGQTMWKDTARDWSQFWQDVSGGRLQPKPWLKDYMGSGDKAGAGSPHEQLRDAIDRNTDALKENTGVLGPGKYGGGQRASRAVPDQWKGYLLDRALEGDAIRRRQVTV